MTRLCVYAGSAEGARTAYRRAAAGLGAEMVRRGVGLVYGGGGVGLMGVLADAVLAGGGDVTGVIPRFLVPVEAHPGLSALRVVETMHERKALMAELADGFVALPGGLGTLEEVAEALTWCALGLHRKPVGLLDVDGYWSGLLGQLARAVADGFLASGQPRYLVIRDDPGELLAALAAWPGSARPPG